MGLDNALLSQVIMYTVCLNPNSERPKKGQNRAIQTATILKNQS
jgi:hypothetical protein